MNNSQEFILASDIVKKLAVQPENSELGELYGLYKQATCGDINITKPNILYFKETKKWEAWDKYKNMNTDDAENEYIKLVNRLIQKYGINEQ
jgi:diazepam-binding inhibitor (GABA receptor modulator, acyl-CoA-binding protein)